MIAPSDPGAGAVVAAAEAVLSVENAPLPLIVCRSDGRVAMANRAMRDLLGYGGDELILNRPVWDLYADAEAGERCFRKLLEVGEVSERLSLLSRRDGKTVATYCSALVTRGDAGTVSLVIGQARPA